MVRLVNEYGVTVDVSEATAALLGGEWRGEGDSPVGDATEPETESETESETVEKPARARRSK